MAVQFKVLSYARKRAMPVVKFAAKQKTPDLIPPDGGWGYVIALSVAIISAVTFLPVTTFGLVFRSLLQNVGDETSGAALVTGIYFGVQWCTGLAANVLLQKMTYRKVGILGAIVYLTGVFSTMFVTSIHALILFFSIFEAFGFGLMFPASLTAFNEYFDKRRTFIYNVLNTILILLACTFPVLTSYCVNNFGIRGTIAIQAAIGLHCLPAVLCLQPVRRHMKTCLHASEMNDVELLVMNKDENEQKELIEQETELLKNADLRKDSLDLRKMRKSRAANVDNRKDLSVRVGLWRSIAKSLDLALFTDPLYVNIAIGIGLCLHSDYTFLSILPLVLSNFDITGDDATMAMTIFYVADIVGRILFSIVAAFTAVKNRNLFLLGAVLVVIFRIAMICNLGFWWVTSFVALLGSVRCLCQTPFPLIIADAYTVRFVTAFSLSMVVTGIISLLSGVLIGAVKNATQNNEVVLYFLTFMNLLCIVSWLFEIVYFKIKRNNT